MLIRSITTKLIFTRISSRPLLTFPIFPFSTSTKTPPQQHEQQKQKQTYLQKQQKLNKILGYDINHSFKSDLIISQQNYKQQIKKLKQAILFQDLLKSEIDILIYDTTGKPFYAQFIRHFFMLFCVVGFFIALKKTIDTDPQFKVTISKTKSGQNFLIIYTLICIYLSILAFRRYPKYAKTFVQKIIYHTQTQNFTFTRRHIWGTKYNQQISRFKILYTENQDLNKNGVNYLNLINMNQYSIGYQYAWKKQDLFSHLISQRIKI